MTLKHQEQKASVKVLFEQRFPFSYEFRNVDELVAECAQGSVPRSVLAPLGPLELASQTRASAVSLETVVFGLEVVIA